MKTIIILVVAAMAFLALPSLAQEQPAEKPAVEAPDTTNEAIEAANARCAQKYGNGWYPGEQRNDGTYPCIPTKATANALSSWGLRPILAHDGV